MGFWDSMSGQQIYENFASAPGPDGLMQAQKHLARVETVYTERENQIRTLAASMEEGWTGDAAGAAQRGAGPLAVAHGGAAQEMATAKDLLANQVDSFYVVKSSVTPVPRAPSEPSTFHNLISFGGARSDYEAGVAKSNAAAQANVAAMDGWTSSSSYNGSMMPTTYGQIDPNAMNVSVAEPKNAPLIGPGTGGGGDIAKPGGGDPGGGKSGYPKTGGQTPSYLGGGSRDAIGMFDPNHYQYLGTDGKTTPVDHKSVSTDPTRPGWPGGPGGTGGQSGGGQGGQGSLGGTGFGAFGGGGSSSGSGSGSGAGGRLGGSGSGSGSSSGSGSGVSGEKSMGSGKGSGAASSGAANESMGRGGAGTPGAKGTGGKGGTPGGMGGGPKGEGGEDAEHQRKYVMEDDQAFQLTEDGERLADPHTGLPITLPVIGQ